MNVLVWDSQARRVTRAASALVRLLARPPARVLDVFVCLEWCVTRALPAGLVYAGLCLEATSVHGMA